jgi:superfamily II DNA or RNA helicase
MVDTLPQMITLRYSPVRTVLQGDITPEMDAALDTTLSFETSGAFFSQKVASGEWDGRTRFYSLRTHTFKSGLIHKVLRFFSECNIEVRLLGFPDIERREQRGEYDLRPHQAQGVDAMFAARRGILQSPPRSGKTMIASAFFDQSRLFPAIFMCNSIDIASQTRDVLRLFVPGAHIGFVGDGVFELGDITVMTVQSAVAAYEVEYKSRRKVKRAAKGEAYKRIGSTNEYTNAQRAELQRYIDGVQCLIYDECHHAQSPIAVTVLNKLRSARAIFGLSATPNYGLPEDMIIEAAIGEMIYTVSYSDLIDRGWLLPPKIFIYKLPKAVVSSSVYQTIYKEAVVDNEFRNTLIARIAEKLNKQGMTVLIVVSWKTHGDRIYEMIKRTHAICLYGDADLETRNRVKDDLNTGRVKCVISTLWDEGVDIEGLHYVINAAGGASPVDTFQRLRSITPNKNDVRKTYGGLIDFSHSEKFLHVHSLFRRHQYKSEPRFEIHNVNVSKWDLQTVRTSFK